MYHWTDTDVESIVALVARAMRNAADESPQATLREVGHILDASSWRFHVGTYASSEPKAAWTYIQCARGRCDARHEWCSTSLLERYAEDHRYLYSLETAEDGESIADCLITRSRCDCRDPGTTSTHPNIACLWVNGNRQLHCLEFSREVGELDFDERDQAVLRILANQLDCVLSPRLQTDGVQNGNSALQLKVFPHSELPRRQREVLELLLVGKNTKQVASELKISVHTVNDYIKAIYRRYDVSCRAELLAAVHVGS